MNRSKGLTWLARILIACVVAWNLQAAFAFLFNPEVFAPSFELAGVPGSAALRGVAVLFFMWNVPYLVACWNPRHHRLSLWEALVMQVVGVFGETLIYFSLPLGHPQLSGSLLRFIVFDAAGIPLLGAALLLTRISRFTPSSR